MKTYSFSHTAVRRMRACACDPLFSGAPWAGAIVLTIWHAIVLALALT